MRTLAVLALISGGCSTLLGISDPAASGAGGTDAQQGDRGSVNEVPPRFVTPDTHRGATLEVRIP